MEVKLAQNDWSLHRIKAALGERGYSLQAVDNVMQAHRGTASRALRGQCYAAAQAISALLDVPFAELFPTSYPRVTRSQAMKAEIFRARALGLPLIVAQPALARRRLTTGRPRMARASAPNRRVAQTDQKAHTAQTAHEVMAE